MAFSSGNATIGGQVGPASVMTAIPAPNLEVVTFDFLHSVLHIEWNAPGGVSRTVDLDMVLTTTLTDTIAATIHTIVASGS